MLYMQSTRTTGTPIIYAYYLVLWYRDAVGLLVCYTIIVQQHTTCWSDWFKVVFYYLWYEMCGRYVNRCLSNAYLYCLIPNFK